MADTADTLQGATKAKTHVFNISEDIQLVLEAPAAGDCDLPRLQTGLSARALSSVIQFNPKKICYPPFVFFLTLTPFVLLRQVSFATADLLEEDDGQRPAKDLDEDDYILEPLPVSKASRRRRLSFSDEVCGQYAPTVDRLHWLPLHTTKMLVLVPQHGLPLTRRGE